jgi:hemerythrin-like domain-containing protein
MNAIRLLAEDHSRVKRLFDDYDTAESVGKKQQIAEEIFRELRVHSRIEEEIFYPAVKGTGAREGKELITESLDQHDEVDSLIDELEAIGMDDPDWDERFQELMESVDQHVQQEEDEMFPYAEKKLKQEMLEELGKQLESQKHVASIT